MTKEFVLPPIGYMTAVLLAQSVPSLDPGWGQFFANGVAVGVLAFYVLYDVKVRGPAQQKTFADALELVRAAHQKEQADSRKAFLDEQNASRQAFVVHEAAIRAHYDQEIAEYRQMLRENMQEMRRAVHDVRDTAQIVVSNQDRHAVEQERREDAREKKFPRAAE
jgi:flagellar biosynthesis GTPase FlhF